ncbi:MAG: diaminopimelate epimerase [Clostridia bacterium]|nr:diaminopimelate epimerase [Clostridia bacterium]MBR2734647.1 diaminopimelate epimerase [Clostridia bacterium]
MKLNFTKMHGCGNDYIYIDSLKNDISDPVNLSIKLSDRRYQIGGDGIILICPSKVADAKMRIFNKDGSEGKMCGNGIRCVAKYLYDNNLVSDKNHITVETLSGTKTLSIVEDNGNEAIVKVDMGKAILSAEDIPTIFSKDKIVNEPITVADKTYNVTCVSMGNPHCVIFCDEVYSADVKGVGSKLSANSIFPEGVNVEFVSVTDDKNLSMRVWERGSGETLACGSGACASVVAAAENGLCKKGEDITVHLRGGKLTVNYSDDGVLMTGNAVKVFEGEIKL